MNVIDQQNTNEISLYDLIRVLRKHMRLFWGIFGLIVVIGVAATFGLPAQYNYMQAIKIGHYVDAETGKDTPVTNGRSMAEKVLRLYLPDVSGQYEMSHGGRSIPFDINVSNIDNGTITLSTKARMGLKPEVENLFQDILKEVQQTTTPMIEERRNYFKHSLAQINDEQQWLNRLSEQLLKSLADLNATSNVGDTTTLKALYTQQMTGLSSKRMLLLQTMTQYKNNLETIENTRFDSNSVIFTKASAVSKPALLVLTIVLAFMLSAFGVFLYEGVQQYRKHA